MSKQLRELARLYGIQNSYVDVRKETHAADPESLLLVLCAMGANVAKMDDVAAALRERHENLANRKVEPVLVAWDGQLAPIKGGEIILEDGSPRKGRSALPHGYHRLCKGTTEALIISAPSKVYFPFTKREWGFFVPVYSLHSKRNSAGGDLTDFENVMDWTGRMGARVAATLPLLASFLDAPMEPSPYSPASRLFWNEFYVDVSRLPEFHRSRKAQQMIGLPHSKAKLVDYRSSMSAKRAILEELARTFFSEANNARRDAMANFIRTHAGVENYARFRSVTDRFHAGWNTWPERLRGGDIRIGDYRESDYRYHLYSQWAVQEQLQAISRKAKASGQALYLDLPLGLHSDSYDVWLKPGCFLRGLSGGAPPDTVSTKGQNWGFPPMHPEAMRLNRHQYTIAYIQNHLRYAQLLRIDHVMGLHRLYCIPSGQSGDKGVYVEYPAEELYAILSLESHRHRAGIVGENLGTVPPEVNAAMSRHNVQKMYVVQYEIAGDPSKAALRKPPRNAVASLNTHDMPPFRAFWDFLDIAERLDLEFMNEKAARNEQRQRAHLKKRLVTFLHENGFLKSAARPKPEAVFRALSAFLSGSPAGIVLVNLEDLWQEVEPQNVPATYRERPNWRRRVRPSVERMRQMTEVIEALEAISTLRHHEQ